MPSCIPHDSKIGKIQNWLHTNASFKLVRNFSKMSHLVCTFPIWPFIQIAMRLKWLMSGAVWRIHAGFFYDPRHFGKHWHCIPNVAKKLKASIRQRVWLGHFPDMAALPLRMAHVSDLPRYKSELLYNLTMVPAKRFTLKVMETFAKHYLYISKDLCILSLMILCQRHSKR